MAADGFAKELGDCYPAYLITIPFISRCNDSNSHTKHFQYLVDTTLCSTD